MLAALAADAPEITAAVTALVRHDQRVGAGVVIGSNVFNLAAPLGLAGIVAGHVALHRRVIELGGAVALWTCVVTLGLVMGVFSPLVGLLAVLGVLVPYVVILGVRHDRLARLRLQQLSNVVDLAMKDDQAATLSSVVWLSWFSSSVTLMPSLNFTPSSTSATSSWPLNRRQRSCADSSSL